MLFSSNFSHAQITSSSLRHVEQSKFDFMKSNTSYLTANNYVYKYNANAYSNIKKGIIDDAGDAVVAVLLSAFISYGLLAATSFSTIISASVLSQKQHVKNRNSKIIGLSTTGAITGAVVIVVPTTILIRGKKEKEKKALRLKQQQNKF
jgi:hypothetical protein